MKKEIIEIYKKRKQLLEEQINDPKRKTKKSWTKMLSQCDKIINGEFTIKRNGKITITKGGLK